MQAKYFNKLIELSIFKNSSICSNKHVLACIKIHSVGDGFIEYILNYMDNKIFFKIGREK